METNKKPFRGGCEIKLTKQRPYIAVASLRGLFVNLKLCESEILRIYKPSSKKTELVDIRTIPGEEIRGTMRWTQLSSLLNDCACLLVNGIARAPRSILMNSGIQVFVVEGFVDKAMAKIGEGKSIHFMDIERISQPNISDNMNETYCE